MLIPEIDRKNYKSITDFAERSGLNFHECPNPYIDAGILISVGHLYRNDGDALRMHCFLLDGKISFYTQYEDYYSGSYHYTFDERAIRKVSSMLIPQFFDILIGLKYGYY